MRKRPRGPGREELAARKAAMRARLDARQAGARERLEAKKATLQAKRARQGGGDRNRKRLLLALLALALLLALLLRTCSCAEPPVEVAAPAVGSAPVAHTEPVEAPPATPGGSVETVQRPSYTPPTPEPVPWLTQFRLQVSSRAPRLAECFVGASEPGALRWTAKVEPSSGLVSDQLIEPSSGAELSKAQRTCVYEVLGDPPYTLEGIERATPVPVGLVVEF